MEEIEEMVCCFACSAIRPINEFDTCLRCDMDTCSQASCRCMCEGTRRTEYPEDAKAFYAIMDELNQGADSSRIAALESQLEVYEQRHGW